VTCVGNTSSLRHASRLKPASFSGRSSSSCSVQHSLDHPETKTTRLVKLVTSTWFESACGLCILANAAAIAYAADYAAQHIDNPVTPTLKLIERAFTSFYTLELALRLIAYKLHFFTAKDWAWNCFDLALVLSAIYDEFVELTTTKQSSNSSVVFLRIVRVGKMLKLLRMIRIMRLFRELRLIVSSIKGSVKSMVWAVLLVLIITYIAGICFVQAGTSFLQENGGHVTDNEFDAIQKNWGAVSTAMLSLYMASTNGENWKDMAETLLPVGQTFYFLFLLYIAFFSFVVVNTLTSLFIEATIQNAEKDKHVLIREELERKNEYMKRAVEFFQHMDQDCSGDISLDQFSMHAADPEMVAFAASLELDVTDITQFYSMLSCRGRYPVDMDTFVTGCMKLKGVARSMDLQGLIASHKRASRTLEKLLQTCNHIDEAITQTEPGQGGVVVLEQAGRSPARTDVTEL